MENRYRIKRNREFRRIMLVRLVRSRKWVNNRHRIKRNNKFRTRTVVRLVRKDKENRRIERKIIKYRNQENNRWMMMIYWIEI